MTLLTNIIIEYLKHNKRLVVPKLGAFIVKKPGGEIIFSELMRNDDGVLRSLLMAYGMKELEANGAIDRLVFEVRHAISGGEKYKIEEFGEFRAGANNTIVFRHHREPIVIGGTIKPPVQRLTDEKIKIQRVRNYQNEQKQVVQGERAKPHSKPSTKTSRNVRSTPQEADDMMSLNKPDSYLRGLKYDQNKNKKREEDMFSSQQRRRGFNIAVMLIAAAIVGAVIWFALPYININTGSSEDNIQTTKPAKSVEMITADSLDRATQALIDGVNQIITADSLTTASANEAEVIDNQ